MISDILDLFPADLRERMVPFASGDLLRLPTEIALPMPVTWAK